VSSCQLAADSFQSKSQGTVRREYKLSGAVDRTTVD
jgi:hypothetical protein